jgi:D-alanyl-D-alanine carboxypeptidase/D-alanyl-D-alanine-endopeptidase (penicillin-binding protein 4)
LYGQGDPSLSSRNYPYNREEPFAPDRLAPLRELARQLKARNVKSIAGNIIGDDSYFEFNPIPNGWSAADGLYEYGAPVGALSFNDNSIALKLSSTGQAFDPPVPYFSVRSTVTPGERTRIQARRSPGSLEILLRGTMKPDSLYTDEFAVEDPALFAALAFRVALEAEGITVQGGVKVRHELAVPQESVELARRESPPLTQILQVVDKVSQNLHAELVRRAAERKQTMDDFLKSAQIDAAKETYLQDGSGLSRQNLVSPRAVVALLRHMWNSPHREQFNTFLPVGAMDGTLRRRFAGQEKAKLVRAKTGTLSHVTALGGYAQSRKYGEVIFQIVANNFNQPSSEVVKVVDCLALLFTQ